MALRAGYKGIKKVGSGLSLSTDGVLSSTGGGPGGETALSDLSDVSIISPSDGQVLQYDANNQKWVNGSGGNVPPQGSTATPTDDIQTWLNCANIWDKTYTTINEVLADSTTLLALISSDNATDYMVRSTTWASAVTANSTAMSLIGADDYCASALLDNSTWRTVICNSTYFESVLNVKVPTLNSSSTGVSAEYSDSGHEPWKAFDGNDIYPSSWYYSKSNGPVDDSITYDFGASCKIYKIHVIYQPPTDIATNVTYTFKGSVDGTTFEDIYTKAFTLDGSTPITEDYAPAVVGDYRYYRLTINSQFKAIPIINTIQYYGRA